MKKVKIYYTVKKELQSVDMLPDIEETTGNKTITVYKYSTEKHSLIILGTLEKINTDNSKEEVINFLEAIKFKDDYELIQLN